MSSSSIEADAIGVDLLIKVLSCLFCRSICREFRKPVKVLYPQLIQQYVAVIKHPMDLGTLLALCIRGKANLSGVRDGLQLVFANAVEFNKDSLDMVGISRHIDRFAAGLFEEILSQPYQLPCPINFRNHKAMARTQRYNFVCREILRDSEIRMLVEHIKSNRNPVPNVLAGRIERAIDIAMKAWYSHEEEPHGSNANITLLDVLTPILEGVVELRLGEYADDDLSTSDLPALTCLMNSNPLAGRLSVGRSAPGIMLPPHISPTVVVNEGADVTGESTGSPQSTKMHFVPLVDTIPYLRELDNHLGVLLVHMQERLLRGCLFSSIWARPYKCVWAQPMKMPW